MAGLTVICLGPGAYVAYEQNKVRKERAAVERVEKLGGATNRPVATSRPPLLKMILGDDSYGKTTRVWLNDTAATDEDLILIARLTSLETLDLGSTNVSDEGLTLLRGLAHLEELSLDSSQITDAGLVNLVDLARLGTVHLERTKVTETGRDQLRRSLPNTRIAP